MCGRIALYTTPERLSRIFDAELALGIDPDGRPSYNIPPTRSILGIVARPTDANTEHPDVEDAELPATKRTIDLFRWGLIPSWAKDASMGNRLFNARSETVATKPSFRSAFASRRLAVPADGFYEWGQGEGKQRQPHYFQRADGDPLALAGLWERWRLPGQDAFGREGIEHDEHGNRPEFLYTCTIITTSAGPDMDGIHPRMPVVLETWMLDGWLDPDNHDRDELEVLLQPPPSNTLNHHPVDARVGNVRNDGPELVEARPPTATA